MTYDRFLQMLAHAAEQGWVSDIHCATHDGIRTTGEEAEQWEEGFDPCAPVIRLWEVEVPEDTIRFDDNLDPSGLLADGELTVADILQSPGTRESVLRQITALLARLVEPELEDALDADLEVGRWIAAVEYTDEGESRAVRLVGPSEVGLVDSAGLLDMARGLL